MYVYKWIKKNEYLYEILTAGSSIDGPYLTSGPFWPLPHAR